MRRDGAILTWRALFLFLLSVSDVVTAWRRERGDDEVADAQKLQRRVGWSRWKDLVLLELDRSRMGKEGSFESTDDLGGREKKHQVKGASDCGCGCGCGCCG